MVLEFEIQNTNSDELDLINSFCDLIIYSMRQDIYNNIIPAKFDNMSQRLLYANWIQWKDKPNIINSNKLLAFILNNLAYTKHKDNQIKIYFKYITLPGTYNRLDQFVRYIDMGNEIAPITLFFTSIFNKYRYNLNDYWKSFIYLQLGDYPKGNIVII